MQSTHARLARGLMPIVIQTYSWCVASRGCLHAEDDASTTTQLNCMCLSMAFANGHMHVLTCAVRMQRMMLVQQKWSLEDLRHMQRRGPKRSANVKVRLLSQQVHTTEKPQLLQGMFGVSLPLKLDECVCMRSRRNARTVLHMHGASVQCLQV